MSQNILVTGGAGYIGSHACKALLQNGYNPITIDSLSTGWQEAVKFGPFEKVDLLDRKGLDQVFLKYKPKAIMHFASFSQVGESVQRPEKYWRNNLVGSLNLLETAIKHNCLDFIFSSTCATYGDHDGIILDENTPQIPSNPYGTSKKAVESMIQEFAVSKGLRFIIFRYFNVAGADPENEIGEFHRPETHLIPLILDVVSGKSDYVTIFGDDFNTKDGSCVRDFVHVCDIVEAHLLGLNWLKSGKPSRVFNLGSGAGFSVFDVIEAVKKITGHNIPTRIGSSRPGDCAKLVSGSATVERELGWVAKRSALNQIISDAWQWHRVGGYVN